MNRTGYALHDIATVLLYWIRSEIYWLDYLLWSWSCVNVGIEKDFRWTKCDISDVGSGIFSSAKK